MSPDFTSISVKAPLKWEKRHYLSANVWTTLCSETVTGALKSLSLTHSLTNQHGYTYFPTDNYSTTIVLIPGQSFELPVVRLNSAASVPQRSGSRIRLLASQPGKIHLSFHSSSRTRKHKKYTKTLRRVSGTFINKHLVLVKKGISKRKQDYLFIYLFLRLFPQQLLKTDHSF